MSVVHELNPLYFHQILHSMIRGAETAEEKERSRDVLEWVGDNFSLLNSVTESTEQRVLGVVWDHYQKHGFAPSRSMVEQMAKLVVSPQNVLFKLQEYDRFVPQMKAANPLDMPTLLETRAKDWQTVRMSEMLSKALLITNGTVPGARKTDPPQAGTQDAVAFIFKQLQDGTIVKGYKNVGGDVSKDGQGFWRTYNQAEQRNKSGTLHMRTGINILDESLGGFQYGEFIGILGYAGSRKSAVARTIGYSVASNGFNVLHIPMEESYEEVRDMYTVMHSYSETFSKLHGMEALRGLGISYSLVRKGAMRDDQKAFLQERVIPDFESHYTGSLIVRKPMDRTWAGLKRMMETEQQKLKTEGKQLDMIIIDYLTLVDVGAERDEVKAKNRIIGEAKALALTFDEGRGVCIVTPIQGSREGEKEARANEGRWHKSGLRMYGEFEAHLNICLYVYVDDDLRKTDMVKIGTCKTRYTDDVPPTTVIADPLAGCIRNDEGVVIRDSEASRGSPETEKPLETQEKEF